VTKLLTLAYHFPPIGGGGVQRNAKFVRYLPAYGFENVVVTGPGSAKGRWTPEDATLLSDVAGSATVARVQGPEPGLDSGFRSALAWRLMRPSAFTTWWIEGAVTTGLEVGADVDLIYASLVPYETAVAGSRLARELGKPWVADLQDPWALDEMWLYPSGAHRRLDLRKMRRLLGTAEAIVMNTPEAATRLVRAFPEFASKLVVSIPNGFDAADFAAPPGSRTDGRFRIVHTGYLHTETGMRLRSMKRLRRVLGGMAYDIDILPRSHVYLLQALESLAGRDAELASRVDVVLAGVASTLDRQIADASSVSVELPGYLSHGSTVELMRTADLLFLPMHDLPRNVRAGLVPGKTYEYLASGRPILGAVGAGDARDLLLAAGNATVCWPTDVEAISRGIESNLRRWDDGSPIARPRPDVVARYERRYLTEQLGEVFDQVLGQNPLERLQAAAAAG
jgi:hypothetical protein